MDRITVSSSHRRGGRFAKCLLQFALALSLGLLMGNRAVAQYGGGGGGTGGGTGGGGGYSGGGYGSSGKAIGIGVGAAAGGAGLLFLAMHNHGRMTGCVQSGEDGLRFVDEKKNQSYTLVAGDVLVKPGQRVQLKGQKSKSSSGVDTFEAKKLIKDLGACGAASPASTSASNPASQ
jgi:hypothetical protein